LTLAEADDRNPNNPTTIIRARKTPKFRRIMQFIVSSFDFGTTAGSEELISSGVA
jgi:hypothetical protein